MGKRLTDTDIWNKEWFQLYTLKQKVLLRFLFDNCDAAGVWEPNYRLAGFIIGEPITRSDIESLNGRKKQVAILPDGKVVILDFISFQYGELSETCRPHQKVFELLKKHGLTVKGIDTLSDRVSDTLQYKDKEQDKNISQDLENNTIRTCEEERPVDKSFRFHKPTPEEVEAYCRERNNGVDAARFWNFYESKGWKVGKNPMKDWRAAVRTWEKVEMRKPAPSVGLDTGLSVWDRMVAMAEEEQRMKGAVA